MNILEKNLIVIIYNTFYIEEEKFEIRTSRNTLSRPLLSYYITTGSSSFITKYGFEFDPGPYLVTNICLINAIMATVGYFLLKK